MKSHILRQRSWTGRRHLIGGLILFSLLFFGYYLPVIVTMLLMMVVAWMALIVFIGFPSTVLISLVSFLIPLAIYGSKHLMGIAKFDMMQNVEFSLQSSLLVSMVWGAVVWINRLLKAKKAGFDEVIGACNLYVWIATIYACFYTLISKINPEAFHLQALLSNDLSIAKLKQNFNELYYFSFVTQTTLGYGDIVPLSHPARALAISQAIIGQFYVAVVLTYILNLWIRDLGHHVDQKLTRPEESKIPDTDFKMD